jgi:hypothetical protein
MLFKKSRGYLLLQCAIALFCVGLGMSLLLRLHVKSLHTQKNVTSHAWAVVQAASAQHIQHFYSNQAHQGWQAQLDKRLPAPQTDIEWHSQGAIQLCWEGEQCWHLE